jgi:hypothetical protein
MAISDIDISVPAQGAELSSAPLRANFGHIVGALTTLDTALGQRPTFGEVPGLAPIQTLVAGANVTVSADETTRTIAADVPVKSLVAGDNITITPAGTARTIAADVPVKGLVAGNNITLENVDGVVTVTAADSTAPVASVAGKTGVVTLVKADVGLNNVNNTADASKPISTATQAALDGKLGLHAQNTVSGLTIAVVAALPATPVANVLYLVTG